MQLNRCFTYEWRDDFPQKWLVVDDHVVYLEILGAAAGQEEYSTMSERYMRFSEGYMLIYSVTSRASFDSISRLCRQLLRIKDTNYFPMIVVGNHCDRESDRQVSKEEGEALARSFGCPFLEASVDAEQRGNVKEAFYDLVREIRRYRVEMQAHADEDTGG
jgi:GTPase KRas protein